MKQSGISVEVVIPSYNRTIALETTLEHIRIVYPDLDICLGLQGEVSQDLLKKVQSWHKMRVLQFDVPGTTAALNKCISSSNADVVLILDDDASVYFGCVEAHIDAFIRDPDIAYTSGRELRFSKSRPASSHLVRIMIEKFVGLSLANDKKLNGRIVGWISRTGLMFGNFDQPGTCKINSPRGCNMAVRRTEFININGFNEAFKGNAWGFEADFGLRMARHGKFGVYIGNALVVHHEFASGGSRQANKWQWYRDFLHNHSLLIAHLGVQAWLGSLPRLTKNLLRIVFE